SILVFFFQAEDGIRDGHVTGVQTCALPICRLPVIGTLHELVKAALVQILTQPRNAITRQYMKLFEYENVKLRFTDDALEAIAERSEERRVGKSGERGGRRNIK